jgi:hypothetical protein
MKYFLNQIEKSFPKKFFRLLHNRWWYQVLCNIWYIFNTDISQYNVLDMSNIGFMKLLSCRIKHDSLFYPLNISWINLRLFQIRREISTGSCHINAFGSLSFLSRMALKIKLYTLIIFSWMLFLIRFILVFIFFTITYIIWCTTTFL